MKTWNEFIKWLKTYPEIITSSTEYSTSIEFYEPIIVVATPFAVEAETEEAAKQALMEAITERIGDGSSFKIWIRVIPEVQKVIGSDKWMGYSRIAYTPIGC